ncbi:unnamed protein product [Caretta caretta]
MACGAPRPAGSSGMQKGRAHVEQVHRAAGPSSVGTGHAEQPPDSLFINPFIRFLLESRSWAHSTDYGGPDKLSSDIAIEEKAAVPVGLHPPNAIMSVLCLLL